MNTPLCIKLVTGDIRSYPYVESRICRRSVVQRMRSIVATLARSFLGERTVSLHSLTRPLPVEIVHKGLNEGAIVKARENLLQLKRGVIVSDGFVKMMPAA